MPIQVKVVDRYKKKKEDTKEEANRKMGEALKQSLDMETEEEKNRSRPIYR
jgi:hypothetical protein